MLKRLCLSILLTASVVVNNDALLITPSTPTIATGTTSTNPDLSPLVLAYKGETDGNPDSGFAAGWYTTTFTPNAPTDEAIDAKITWDGGSYITGVSPIHLLVKDGNHAPTWYLFDISGWDGKDIIDIKGFWPDGGAISHVSIFTGSTSVPDGGATAALLGLGVLGLVAFRRKS